MMISVIIPTFRRPDVLASTLAAWEDVRFPDGEYEIVIVDDAGDPETREVVEAHRQTIPRLKLLTRPGRGAAAARNEGAREATGDLLLFCDDDISVSPQHLELHVKGHRELGDVLLGGNRWYSPASLAALQKTSFGRYRVELERGFDHGQRTQDAPDQAMTVVNTLPSFDLSLRRDTFWRLGGFDEAFPYAGAEDQDLSTRARLLGLRLIRDSAIQCLHDDPTTTLRQFALREERGAHTVVRLTRKFPEYLGDFYKNEPIRLRDSPRLTATKLLKWLLSRRAPLLVLHRAAAGLEKLEVRDERLWDLYRVILGLHIFRGYREARKDEHPTARPGRGVTLLDR